MFWNRAGRRVRRIVMGMLIASVAAAVPMVQAGDEITIVSQWHGSACNTGADVWGEGDLAFWGHFGGNCLDILDVSDPANPVWLADFRTTDPDRGASLQDVRVHNGLAYIAYEGNGNNGAAIVDVRDPTNPVLLTTIRINAGNHDYSDIHNLFYHEGYLYLADGRTTTVPIVDLTDYDPDNPPGHITDVKWLMTGVGSRFVHDITVLKDRMYVSAWNDIMVYDISNIANELPVFLGSAPGSASHANWATDDQRYIITSEEREQGGIKLYEVTEGLQGGLTITLLDEVTEGPGTSAHNPIIVCDRVYTSWYGRGLIVHQIDAEAGQLVEVGRVDPGTVWGVYPLIGLDRVILGAFDGFFIADASLDATPCDDIILLPDDLTIIRGVIASGELADMFTSNDSRMVFHPGITLDPEEPPVWLQLHGVATTDTPGALKFTLETRVSTPSVTQTIELFNFDIGEYEEVDVSTTTMDDSVVEVVIDVDPSRFINSETLEMSAQLTWKPPPLVLMFPWSVGIDQAIWSIPQ